VLDDIERGRVLEQPARKHLAPGERLADRGPLLDEDLREGTGFRRILPRCSALARGELDDDVVDPLRFARLKLQLAGQVVAFVEQTKGGDPLGQRGNALLLLRRPAPRHRRLRRVGALLAELDPWGKLGLAFAGGERQRGQRQRQVAAPPHRRTPPAADLAQGVHAS
jgi:hypothetical protein